MRRGRRFWGQRSAISASPREPGFFCSRLKIGRPRNRLRARATNGPTTMDSPNDIASRIMAAIAALPPPEQADAIHSLIGGLLKQMPVEGILQMREEISSQFEEDVPIVNSTLDLIDGQLALREIA